jgi:hypothetical protein
MVNNKIDIYFYITGFILIFGILNIFQNTMVFDIDFFRHFSNCFGKNVYTDINCPAYGDTIFFKPNYPALGIVFTSGFFWIFNEFISNDNYVQIFRNYLGIFDFISYVIFFNILKILSIKNYQIKSLSLIILPSTILSGSMFGQIEHLMLTFFLGFLYFLILDFKKKFKKIYHFNLSIIFLFSLFLIKLQSIFLIPGVTLILIINLYQTYKLNLNFFKIKLVCFFLFLSIFVFLDSVIFNVPNYFGINSTLLHSFIYGKSAASIISLHATNIWSVLDKFGFNIFNGIYEAFATFEINSNLIKSIKIELVPIYLGLTVFIIFYVEFIFDKIHSLFNLLKKKMNDKDLVKILSIILLICSFSYIFYCTVMPGMNIRYIYLFYPLFLLKLIIDNKFDIVSILFLLSVFFFIGIISNTIGIEIISQFFPITSPEINKFSYNAKISDMQIIGSMSNLLLIFVIYTIDNKINYFKYLKKRFFFTLVLILVFSYNFLAFNPTKILFDKNQDLKKFEVYFDYGEGFNERDKAKVDLNEKNYLIVSKNLKSFRIDPNKFQTNFTIEKFKITNDKKNLDYKIKLLKNIHNIKNLFIIKNNDDPYIIFEIKDFKSIKVFNLKIIILILIIVFIFIKGLEKILIFKNAISKYNK